MKRKTVNHDEILKTRAALAAGGERIKANDCERCEDPLLFGLKDRNHEFSLGLSTVLECLKLAEKEGAVPKLPPDWWWRLEDRYRLKLYLLE